MGSQCSPRSPVVGLISASSFPPGMPSTSILFCNKLNPFERLKLNMALLHSLEKGGEIEDDNYHNIAIFDIGKPLNRRERILKSLFKVYNQAINLNADLYHLHDPELIPVGLKLKKDGKIVVYDVHEDVPRQILSKSYIKTIFRPLISKSFEIFENWAVKKFDAIIAATPHIRDRFIKLNPNTVDINNFPKKDELYEPVDWLNRKNEICYIGGISKIRGIVELIKALEYVNTTLHLAGNFESKELKKEVMNLKGWKKVKYYGFVDRNKIKEILKTVKIGIVTLHPTQNYIYSLPVKMFEYMSAGIPVVASNFSLWRDLIEKNNAGICVNPLNPKEIAEAINILLNNNNLAKNMGLNGRKLIEEKYNWAKEEEKLISLYKKLLEEN